MASEFLPRVPSKEEMFLTPCEENTNLLQLQVNVGMMEGGVGIGREGTITSSSTSSCQNRFKVVKINNKDPFTRGRWLCLDYSDPPEAQRIPFFPGPPSVPSPGTSSAVASPSVASGQSPLVTATNVAEAINIANEAISSGTATGGAPSPPPPAVAATVESIPVGCQTTAQPQVEEQVPFETQPPGPVHPPVGLSLPLNPAPSLPNPLPAPALPVHDNAVTNNVSTVTSPPQVEAVSTSVPTVESNPPPTLSAAPTLSAFVAPIVGHHTTEGDFSGEISANTINNNTQGTGTVAIDNKIEQAMDLVKSHLMYAVREEVDVLKEKIVDLMDRITYLEAENTALRQHISPEVLASISVSNQPDSNQTTSGPTVNQDLAAPSLPPVATQLFASPAAAFSLPASLPVARPAAVASLPVSPYTVAALATLASIEQNQDTSSSVPITSVSVSTST